MVQRHERYPWALSEENTVAANSCWGESAAPLRFLVVRVTVATALSFAPLATVIGAACTCTAPQNSKKVRYSHCMKHLMDSRFEPHKILRAANESFQGHAWGAAARLISSSITAFMSLPKSVVNCPRGISRTCRLNMLPVITLLQSACLKHHKRPVSHRFG